MTGKDIAIDTIGLSVRSINALHRIEVHTVGDMLRYDEEQLLQVRNLGRKSVQEILAKIEEYKALEVSDGIPANSEPEQMGENAQTWMESEHGRKQIVQWLQEKNIRIDVLEMDPGKRYTLDDLNNFPEVRHCDRSTLSALFKLPAAYVNTKRGRAYYNVVWYD